MLTLVLEEDGTAVESEDFFQLLEDDTCLMVLESGQSWSPSRVRPVLGCYRLPILSLSPRPLLLPNPHLEGRSDERGKEFLRTPYGGLTVQARVGLSHY